MFPYVSHSFPPKIIKHLPPASMALSCVFGALEDLEGTPAGPSIAEGGGVVGFRKPWAHSPEIIVDLANFN